MSATDIFDRVAPAIAYVETPASTGSGALTDGGYVVTSAHVVWPFGSARVVFPDGSEFPNAPVKQWDLLADLAVLGPLEAPPSSSSALPFEGGENPAIGTEAYLIGYPGEVEAFPQPAIVRGIVSRIREWEAAELTYFQTDAAIAGGQSGGALASESGRILGISGLSFSEAGFGLVLSMADAAPRVRALIDGRDPSGLGERRVSLTGGASRHNVTLSNFWDQRAYILNEQAGTDVEFRMEGVNDGWFAVYDLYGEELLRRDETATGAESGGVSFQYDEPHFLVTAQLSEAPGDFVVSGGRRLVPLSDTDDGRQLSLGQTLWGNMDYPSDADYFLLTLRQGERIEVSARSALSDPFLLIDYHNARDDQIIADDDSGGGLFGADALIVYEAPHTGRYFVVVQDYDGLAPGGYALTAREARPGAELTTATRADFLGLESIGFGLDELRASFDPLPNSFEELDPASEGLSASELDVGSLTDAVTFASSQPFQLILAYSGQLSDLERIALDAELESPDYANEFRQGILSGDWQGVQSLRSGTLELRNIGDKSVGVWAEVISEGVLLRIEAAVFRRGSIAAVVYSYFRPSDSPSATIQEAARLLDAAIARHIAG